MKIEMTDRLALAKRLREIDTCPPILCREHHEQWHIIMDELESKTPISLLKRQNRRFTTREVEKILRQISRDEREFGEE